VLSFDSARSAGGSSEPADRPLDDPAATIAAQAATVLIGRLGVVRAGGNDRLDAAPLEEAAYGVAVVAAIADQALGLHADRLARERFLEERDLRRGRLETRH
jgi:hypothetical protein